MSGDQLSECSLHGQGGVIWKASGLGPEDSSYTESHRKRQAVQSTHVADRDGSGNPAGDYLLAAATCEVAAFGRSPLESRKKRRQRWELPKVRRLS